MFAKIMAFPIEVEPDIPAFFGPGADPEFDKVLSSLGHIGSHKPTPVINTVMYWRAHKVKSEPTDGTVNRPIAPAPANVPAAAAAAIVQGTNQTPIPGLPSLPPTLTGQPPPPSLLRRQTEPVSVSTPTQMTDPTGQYSTQRAALTQAILRDRQKNCAVYILCRALIEVVKNTTAEALSEDVASRIEPIVFRELINQVPDNYSRSKAANWSIFAELLGCFSIIRYPPSNCIH
jgi:hypothetical protein